MEIEIQHKPTDEILKDMKYNVYCSCGNRVMASDEPIPSFILMAIKVVPCSKCVKPEDYLKELMRE